VINVRFITVCHGLHNYGGHEYMYTKGICDSLPDNYICEVWGRKDVIPEIINTLSVRPVFSNVEYNQEMNIFLKSIKLFEREVKWFGEMRTELKKMKNASSDANQVVFFVHTFSIYNIWSWLCLLKIFRLNNFRLILFFRYSILLLPRPLKPIHRWICSKLPKNDKRFLYLTDTEELKLEYFKASELNLDVMPVVAKTTFGMPKLLEANGDGQIRLSYLGSARVDKGFQHMPLIVEKVFSAGFDKDIQFIIQASIPGVDYLESSCAIALQRLKELSLSEGYNIELIFEHLSDQDYEELLSKTNLVLLPYTGLTYKVQSSGILVESMAHGLPCIVPKDTWMESELSRTGAGLAFNPENPNDIAEKVCTLIADFPSYDKLAKEGVIKLKGVHGASAQAAELQKLLES
jgi:glycosyltransferase involved in cell wall biosynthesis